LGTIHGAHGVRRLETKRPGGQSAASHRARCGNNRILRTCLGTFRRPLGSGLEFNVQVRHGAGLRSTGVWQPDAYLENFPEQALPASGSCTRIGSALTLESLGWISSRRSILSLRGALEGGKEACIQDVTRSQLRRMGRLACVAYKYSRLP
jgi:hypothetical protein